MTSSASGLFRIGCWI